MNIKLRDPNIVMKLSRLGSFHQSRLSFLRSFLSEFKDWDYKRDLFNLNEKGYGTAVYSFKKNDRVYSLICFANEISDDERSDRVIATKWDAAFTLHDGAPLKKDIERLKNEVPKQEVGRLSYKELTLSRANKSVRIFEHVVENLSKGIQPDLDLLEKVGKFETDTDKAVITLVTEKGISTHILDLNDAEGNLRALSLKVLD